jgi:hypothetical protein
MDVDSGRYMILDDWIKVNVAGSSEDTRQSSYDFEPNSFAFTISKIS